MINRFIIIFLFQFLFYFSVTVAKADNSAAVVQVDNVIDIEISPVVWVPGDIISRYDSKISSEVEGKVISIVDAGDFIKKGDVIGKIENTRYKLNYSEIKAEIEPIESQLRFYTSETERLKKLAKDNNAAKNKLEEIESNKNEAIAKIKLIKSRLSSAEDLLMRTTIRAPFTGIITNRYKSLGERVDYNDEIVRLVDTSNSEVQSYIQSESLKYIEIGDLLEMKVNSKIVDGIVTKLIPVADNISKLYEIRIAFKNDSWPIGAAVEIACPINNKQKVLAVPRDALVIRESGVILYRVNSDNRVTPVPIKTGISNKTHIQVIGDIKLNDQIVIRGNERLRPNQPVKIINNLDN